MVDGEFGNWGVAGGVLGSAKVRRCEGVGVDVLEVFGVDETAWLVGRILE